MSNLFLTCIVCAFSILANVEARYKYGKYPPCEPNWQYPVVRDADYGETYIPIQLETKKCHAVSLPEMKFTVYDDVPIIAHNIGNHIFFTACNSTAIAATLTGGPCYNETYYYCNCNFAWDNTPTNTHAWRLQDGQGTQMEFQVEFYKKPYCSREPAVEYRDGLVDVNVPCAVHQGEIGNPEFNEFQKCMAGIQEYNTTCPIRAGDVLPFIFNAFKCGHPFYAYPGARPDKVGKALFCAHVISCSVNSPLWISADQFKVFTNLRSCWNQTIPKVYQTFDMGSRPCVQSVSPVCVHRKCGSKFP